MSLKTPLSWRTISLTKEERWGMFGYRGSVKLSHFCDKNPCYGLLE